MKAVLIIVMAMSQSPSDSADQIKFQEFKTMAACESAKHYIEFVSTARSIDAANRYSWQIPTMTCQRL